MCELLVRVVDKVNDDPYLDAQCLKRGDVVVVCEDGWPWSAEEQKNPHWRIVRMPGIPAEKALAFLGPELPESPEDQSRVLRRRAFKFDVDALPEKFVADDKRDEHAVDLAVTERDLSALKLAKARAVDPNVLE